MSIHRSTQKLNKIAHHASDLSGAGRPFCVGVVLGLVVANELDIPTNKVDNPRRFYMSQYSQAVDRLLFEVNDITMLDIDTCRQLIMNLWLARYRLVFPTNIGYEGIALAKSNLLPFLSETTITVIDVLETTRTSHDWEMYFLNLAPTAVSGV